MKTVEDNGENGESVMSKEFEIVREFEVEASPEQVWEAVTSGTAGWLWPMEYEPREGGAAPFGGVVAAWDPPHRLVARSESPVDVPQQSFNQIEEVVEEREGGGSRVRYVHSGIFVDDWDNQYDGANRHTDFYLHTLGEYLRHFAGRPAVYATVDAPGPAGGTPRALETASRALDLPWDAAAGDTVRVRVPGAPGATEAVLDYHTAYFIGLRTPDAMYRFFGRNHFGSVVGVSVHAFAPGADAAALAGEWGDWLAGVYA